MLTRTIAATAGLLAAAALLMPATPARACGGFFCNAVTLTPIYQAGERVVFARSGDLVNMHVEVTYAGDPTKFGWILPLPSRPMDASGTPLPLERAVRISSPSLFTQLQAQTNPQFRVARTTDGTEGCFGSPPMASGAFDSATGEAQSTSADGRNYDEVQVLDEAKVGPYDAQMIQATSSQALFDWLNANGYYQDPASQPLLAHYVGLGHVFVGIRLQSGRDTDALRPLAMTLNDTAACVPLRLTSIAAAAGMPIMVFVLGDHRAYPKNFLHAVVNEKAIVYPGGSNYFDLVSEAVDTAAGRAWVTEFSGDATSLRGAFLPDSAADLSALRSARDLRDILAAVRGLGIPLDDAWDTNLREEVSPPTGMNDAGTNEAEFYDNIDFWAEQDAGAEVDLEVDAARIAQRVEAEIIGPLADIEAMFDSVTTVTRFFTTLDPEEMTRDPVFGFNPDLPPVDGDHVVDVHVVADDACDPTTTVTWPDGTTTEIDCPNCLWNPNPTIQPVDGEPALKWVEVLLERGPPVAINPLQAVEVDLLFDLAEPTGAPITIPPDLIVPPVEDPPAGDPAGCSAAPESGGPWLGLGLGLLLLGVLRRRVRETRR